MVQELAARYIVREAGQYLNGTLSIDRLGGNLFFGLELENVGVSMDGSQVVAVEGPRARLQRVRAGLERPVGRQHPAEQTGHLPSPRRRPLVDQPPDQETGAGGRPPGAVRPISIDAIDITDGQSSSTVGELGRTSVRRTSRSARIELPKRFEHLDAKLAFQYEPVRYTHRYHPALFPRVGPRHCRSTRCRAASSVRDDTVYVDQLALTHGGVVAVG